MRIEEEVILRVNRQECEEHRHVIKRLAQGIDFVHRVHITCQLDCLGQTSQHVLEQNLDLFLSRSICINVRRVGEDVAPSSWVLVREIDVLVASLVSHEAVLLDLLQVVQ